MVAKVAISSAIFSNSIPKDLKFTYPSNICNIQCKWYLSEKQYVTCKYHIPNNVYRNKYGHVLKMLISPHEKKSKQITLIKCLFGHNFTKKTVVAVYEPIENSIVIDV